ncbi:hypothetical protein [Burkholderia gladioli]|uniref:hypothetical protein n=1 Tax=Burkholderia gladioli TaxID=28095 RepID=UPI000F51BD98|nr:hypothetical protein [Burkholderia gladioli]
MLKKILRSSGVNCIHVIDDAFDTRPSFPLSAEAAQSVVDNLTTEKIAILRKELKLPETTTAETYLDALQDTENYQYLYGRRDQLGDIWNLLYEEYETQQNGKRKQIQPLLDLLSTCELDVQPFGADYTVSGSKLPQVVFVDLKLREDGAQAVTAADAVSIIQKLREVHDCKPFVFLMSSLAKPLRDEREGFRKSAKLFASQFESLDKRLFTQTEELGDVLSRYLKVLPKLMELEGHFGEIKSAMSVAADGVMETLRSMDLADYFALFHNTTAVEKVGLGTYFVELLLEFFAHKFEGSQAIWALAEGLDKFELKELPRSRFSLSAAAGEIYSANMVHAEARLETEKARALGPVDGFFYLGDIFFPAQNYNEVAPTQAFAVITPACDLVRPKELLKRSIMLCEGSVKVVGPTDIPTATDALPDVVMPHPTDKKKQLLVTWRKKKLHVWHKDEMEAFKDPTKCAYIRGGRLRPLYALQLQHAVTADLSRIGTQRPPSLLRHYGVQCYFQKDGIWQEIDLQEAANPTAAGLSTSVRENDEEWAVFVISDSHVTDIRQKLLENLPPKEAERVESAIEKAVRSSEFVDRLMYHQCRVPEKSDTADFCGYPFLDFPDLTGNDRNVVALVRPRLQSPYKDVAANRKVSDKQIASLVICLREISAKER